jgi:RNA polymerase sigma-70 factor (ECF subfamily)
MADGAWVSAEVRGRAPDAQAERVREALALLSPKQRAAVVLTTFEGMTHLEASAMLGCAENTLSGHLFAARRRLAQLLKEEGRAP